MKVNIVSKQIIHEVGLVLSFEEAKSLKSILAGAIDTDCTTFSEDDLIDRISEELDKL